MSSPQISSLDGTTADQLLPVAATVVAAGTGAEVAEILPDREHALGTVITCYILFSMSFPLALFILVT